jgi:hypothetical protein
MRSDSQGNASVASAPKAAAVPLPRALNTRLHGAAIAQSLGTFQKRVGLLPVTGFRPASCLVTNPVAVFARRPRLLLGFGIALRRRVAGGPRRPPHRETRSSRHRAAWRHRPPDPRSQAAPEHAPSAPPPSSLSLWTLLAEAHVISGEACGQHGAVGAAAELIPVAVARGDIETAGAILCGKRAFAARREDALARALLHWAMGRCGATAWGCSDLMLVR